MKLRFCVILLIVAIYCLFVPRQSQCAMLQQLAIHPKSIALANTVTAYPPDIMAVHFNPAGLSKLEGNQFTIGFLYADLKITNRFEADPNFGGFMSYYHDDPLAGQEGTSSGNIAIPGYRNIPMLAGPFPIGISTQKEDSPWTFAYALYAPFIGGVKRGEKDPGRFGAISLALGRIIYASPSVAYKFNDKFSLGLSVGLGTSNESIVLDVRAPNHLVALTGALGEVTDIDMDLPIIPLPLFGGGINPYDRIAHLNFYAEDYFTQSYNLGLMWEPSDWFTFGIVYQSESKAEQSGDFVFKYDANFQKVIKWFNTPPILNIFAEALGLPSAPVSKQEGRMSVEFVYPQRVQAGIMLKPFEDLKLLCDFHWVDWSVWETNRLIFDQDIQLLQFAQILGAVDNTRVLNLPHYQKSKWNLSYGIEYQMLDWLAVRFGYEERKSSIPMDYFGTTIPLADMTVYGTGFGIKWSEQTTIDLAFTYITSTTEIPNNTSHFSNSTDITALLYNPHAGLDVEVELNVMIFAVGINYRW